MILITLFLYNIEGKMKKYYSMTYLTKKESLRQQGHYNKVLAITNNLCFRCGYTTQLDYCPNCEEFGRLSKIDYLYHLDIVVMNKDYIKRNSALSFTKLQSTCAEVMIQAYLSHESMLIWAVCGAGKTEITFPVIEKALINKENICFAIPRIDILYDVYERLVAYFPNVEIKVLNSKEDKYTDAQIYVMTTNQILKFKKAFSICIVDEVDAYPYEHNVKYDYGVNTALIPGGSIFYLTSTPSDLIKSKKIAQFIINRRWHGFDLPIPQLRYLNLSLIKYSYTLNRVIKDFTRQQLWFVSNIKLAQRIYEIYKDKGLRLAYVFAADENRREKIIKFKNHEIDILITTTILERGVTFDDIDVFILDASSPMYNKAALIQIAGRVNRKKEFQNGKVVFFNQGITKIIEESISEIKKMNAD